MRKISSADIARVTNDMADALVSVTVERDAALEKLAKLECEGEAEKIARSMHDKGVELDRSLDDLTAHLVKEAEQGNLPHIRRAVDMLTPNMGLKTASLTSDERVSGGIHPFEQYILEG